MYKEVQDMYKLFLTKSEPYKVPPFPTKEELQRVWRKQLCDHGYHTIKPNHNAFADRCKFCWKHVAEFRLEERKRVTYE